MIVDDKPRSVEGEVKRVREFLEKNGLALNLIESKDGTGIDKLLGEHAIDIVATDKNLTGDMSGLDVISAVGKIGLCTDVLLYSGKDLKIKELREKIAYGFVDIVESKEFADRLIILIEKSIRRWKDIIHLRGLVISKTIDIELQLNLLFAKLLQVPDEMVDVFHDSILENSSNTFEGKVKALEKIMEIAVPDKKLRQKEGFTKLIDDLRELQRNRNYLAHCKRDLKEENCLISMGETKRFDKEKVMGLFSSAQAVSLTIESLGEKLSVKLNERNKV